MTTTARKYTPEQVSALSDKELNKAVAECVFGGFHYSLGKFYVDNGTRRGRIVSVAEPSSVLFVLEHMRHRWARTGVRWEIGDEDDDVWVIEEDGSVGTESPGPRWVAVARAADGIQISAGESPSFGRAIFECALLSMQS